VAIGDIDAPLAETTAGELGAGTIGLPLDVTDRESFAAFLDEAERQLGPLDVLINNAGIMPVGPFEHETDDCAARLVDINIHGVILGSKLAIERFKPRGRGHIVQLASIAGKGGFPGGATYCATKHAVVGLSDAIRAEVRGTEIDVSIVMPTVVRTELGSGLPETRGFKFAEPSDVADAIVEALQTGRVDVYVPRSMVVVVRSAALLPRRAAEFLTRLFRADRVLANPDPVARSAYERRTADASATAGLTGSAHAAESTPAAPGGEAAVAPAASSRQSETV
jgi:short-subunit dehydrogenase